MHRNRQLAVLLLVGLTMLLGSAVPPAPVIAAGATLEIHTIRGVGYLLEETGR